MKTRPGATPILLGILVAAVLGLIILFYPAYRQNTVTDSSATPTPAPIESTSLYGPLLGRWLRTDGDYLLDVRAVDGAGNARVDYFNPRPIHVARAEASRENDRLKLIVVLEDVGYPGSSYTLTYSPSERSLVGEYYQAAMEQTFDVTFTPLP
jgi:hypothetical protein